MSHDQCTEAYLFGPNCKPTERISTIIQWFRNGALDRLALRSLLASAWTSADAPGIVIHKDDLVDLFRSAGFVSDAVPPKRRPRRARLVYRGCHPDAQLGLSWTLNPAVAQWFATNYHELAVVRAQLDGAHIQASPRAAGRVYQAVADPEAMLGVFDERREEEVLVDPAMLRDVRELTDELA